jgi:hypothetical protein
MTASVASLRSSRRPLADILLLARIVAGLAIILAARDGRPYLHHLAFVAGLALVTWGVRGIGWAAVYDAFVAGVVTAYVILAVQWLVEIKILGGASPTFRSSVIAPFTEEPLKIAPLILLVLVLPWRARWSNGACDLMMCGAALGSGFGFVEDSLRHASSYGHTIGFHLFGIPLTPDARSHFIGHGGSAAFIGLAIGWWVWMSRWKKLRAIAVGPPIAVACWMIFDHGIWNYSTLSMDRFTSFLWSLDGRGESAPYAFVVAVLVTLVAEWIVLFKVTSKLRRVALPRALAYVRAPLAAGFGYPELRGVAIRVRGVFLYWLARRQLAYLAAYRRGDVPLDRQAYAAALAQTTGRVMVAQAAIANP